MNRKPAHPTSASPPVIWRSPRLTSPHNDRDTRDARLLAYSSPEMDGLYRRLNNADLTIVLCDQDGLILGLVGASALAGARECSDDASAPSGDDSPVARLPAIMHDRPASVIRTTQHGGPLVADLDLFGIAAPILSPEATPQGILGILGFFTPNLPRAENLSHPNALLQTTAEIIEHRLIENDERGFLVLGFHPRRGVLGSPLEALAVFDRDGRLLSANRIARRLLALGESTPEARCMDFFEDPWHSLVAHANLCIADPFTLFARDGTSLFARAILR